MFKIDISNMVPDFILNDKNGYAIAKALEAGAQMMNDIIAKGVACVLDYDTMPEWRLDELAWETNCLYDYNADVETKRKWIKNAIPWYRLYGTPEAVYRYVSSYFDDIILEENWEYDGEPYHFRVTVDGVWTPENEAWARKAIETAKNVRSVLDALQIGSRCNIGMTAECEVLARFHYPMTSPDNLTGRWPDIAHEVVIDKSAGAAAISAEAEPHRMPYRMTGTIPQENTIGVLDKSGAAGIEGSAEAHPFDYAMTGNAETGTVPQENLLAEIDSVSIAVSGDAQGKKINYPMAGTIPQESLLAEIDNVHMAVSGETQEKKINYPMTGTIPQESLLAEIDNAQMAVSGDAQGKKINYPMTGTIPQESLLAEIEKVQIGISGEADGKKYDYPMSGTGNEEAEAHGKEEIQTADAEDIKNAAGRGEDEF